MQRLFVAGLAAGLAAILISSAAIAQERVIMPLLIQTNEPFSVDGVVSSSETNWGSRVEISKKEVGSIDGISYRIFYRDGSGAFAGKKGHTLAIMEDSRDNWSVRCSKDSMSDAVQCSANTRDLTVVVVKGGAAYLYVGAEHFPGSDVAIRLGSEPPVIVSSDAQFGRAASEQLISHMRDGVLVSTRYQRWPYERSVDQAFELYGFEQVMSYLKWATDIIE